MLGGALGAALMIPLGSTVPRVGHIASIDESDSIMSVEAQVSLKHAFHRHRRPRGKARNGAASGRSLEAKQFDALASNIDYVRVRSTIKHEAQLCARGRRRCHIGVSFSDRAMRSRAIAPTRDKPLGDKHTFQDKCKQN